MEGYIQILIFTMLFVVVIEMIFPNSDLKKYIKLILSCVVIYTLLQPILELSIFDGKDRYSDYVMYYDNELGIGIEGLEQSYPEDIYEEIFVEAYKIQEEEQIKELLKTELGIQANVVEVEVDMTQYIPEVKSIDIIIDDAQEADENQIIKVEIPKIRIGDKSIKENGEEDQLKKDIKNCLGNFYNWDKVNIHISVQGN